MDIEQFNIRKELLNYLEENNISNYFPVQEKVIPLLLKNESVIVESPTGTGKTLAFLLPILNNIEPNAEKKQSIIFVPTRELANQIWSVTQEIKKYFNFSVLLAIGGEEKDKQLQKIKKNPDLIIATPDRLSRLSEMSSIKFDKITSIVIDEADMIIDFGFWNEIEIFFNKYIKVKIAIALFSATLDKSLQNFIVKEIKGKVNKITIERNKDVQIVNLVRAIDDNREKGLLTILNSDKVNPFLALIFCKSNEQARKVYSLIKKNGVKHSSLFSSEMEQRERNRVIKGIKNEDIIYLVTTDLMARGMDFVGVSHIINYNLPTDFTYYRHRIGRTNRGNTKGEIYDIYTEEDLGKYDKIQKKNNWIELRKVKL